MADKLVAMMVAPSAERWAVMMVVTWVAWKVEKTVGQWAMWRVAQLAAMSVLQSVEWWVVMWAVRWVVWMAERMAVPWVVRKVVWWAVR